MRWYNFAVSIHALLAECDYTAFPVPASELCFNPRTPCGVRPILIGIEIEGAGVSIHALLAECDVVRRLGDVDYLVSIHALLAECDESLIVMNP